MRADAQRNRDRIVEVARELVRAKGLDAVSMDEIAKGAGVGPGTLYRHFPTKESLYDAVLEAWAEKVNATVDRALALDAVSMDEIAKGAGVGPGTLYRHFPTKESLYDAVLEAWAEKVNATVDRALALDGPARERLLAWLTDYSAMLTAHKGAAARITAALGDPGSPFAAKCQTYVAANQRLINGLDSALRPGVEAVQISRLVGGVAAVADNSELPADAVVSMLAIVADGLLAP